LCVFDCFISNSLQYKLFPFKASTSCLPRRNAAICPLTHRKWPTTFFPQMKKVWIELNSSSSLPPPVDDVVVDDHRTVYQTILLLHTQKSCVGSAGDSGGYNPRSKSTTAIGLCRV
jgi:hypothetical protein